MRYGKTIVYVADVQASLDFWERAFGFAVRADDAPSYGELDTGDTVLAFASLEAGARHLPDASLATPSADRVDVEIGLVSDDVEADFARAVEAGAIPVHEPETREWGQMTSFLRCPDGTTLDLSSPAPVRPHGRMD